MSRVDELRRGGADDLGEPITSAEPVDPSGPVDDATADTTAGDPGAAGDEPGDHDDVWVVVPVHNAQGMIAAVVDELLEVFPHVVCVDDGSTDRSAAAVAATRAHLVRHCL
ncbi:MAG TPA: glycosyltransferase, partial [Acidimicrobiales bacterium]|nr:glycosyltransferase [Acidimicrobiales bacterium]